ncbi:N-terminal phage integrase SAM-like domain-containing protein [Couchioplanes caeruleus]|uniref:N-terminal phage integrase SAM-like domain-containing protein n=1 Tax=Couchioplanes caeruleus TaxID=56438 RepID=UPI001FD1E588|nr:N-terminal phage integrase SAM-like domain-containing protein [Couchioplanes caeruleus]
MDRYLELITLEPTTRVTYEGYIRNHVRPVLGDLAVGRLGGEVLDSFYAQLRSCRAFPTRDRPTLRWRSAPPA